MVAYRETRTTPTPTPIDRARATTGDRGSVPTTPTRRLAAERARLPPRGSAAEMRALSGHLHDRHRRLARSADAPIDELIEHQIPDDEQARAREAPRPTRGGALGSCAASRRSLLPRPPAFRARPRGRVIHGNRHS
jgi:hypothetical protein